MRDKLQRYLILGMVVLFILTSVGLSAFAILDDKNRQKKDAATQKAASCQFQQVPAEAAATPEAYKPGSDVKQLVTTDLITGIGQPVEPGDCLTVKYYGTLASNGTMFDQNFDQPLGLQFPVGQSQVIPGWDEGLLGMRAGGTRRLIIPSELAYRDQASGTIPANSDLVFVVQLLKIK